MRIYINWPKIEKRENVSMKIIFACTCACLLLLTMAQVGTSQQAELPIWNVGDTWAMGDPDFDIEFTMDIEGISFDVSGSGSCYSIYEVVGAEGQEYGVDMAVGIKMDMVMDISGSVVGEPVSGSMNIEMVMKMDGTFYYTKDELALAGGDLMMDLDIEESGSVKGGGQTQDFSMSMDTMSDMNLTYNPPFDLFDFPIAVGENWTAESTVTITGSISGKVEAMGEKQSFSDQPIEETVNMSASISCPGTVDIPLASTCYELVMSGTGLGQTGPLTGLAGKQYYSPDRGFIVAAESSLSEAMSSAALGSEMDLPYLEDIGLGGEETINLNPVTEQEARDAIAGMSLGDEGISIALIAAIVAIVIIAIVAALVVVRRRHA